MREKRRFSGHVPECGGLPPPGGGFGLPNAGGDEDLLAPANWKQFRFKLGERKPPEGNTGR